MGVHFTGPIKMATKEFPIDAMRWTLAAMQRGEQIVLKSMDHDNLWAVGWHDVHFKCYVTTNGVTTPGEPAHKKRQNREGINYGNRTKGKMTALESSNVKTQYMMCSKCLVKSCQV